MVHRPSAPRAGWEMNHNIDNIFSYNSVTGELFWKQPTGRAIKPGQRAGSLNRQGYIRVWLNYKEILGHRLAWRLHYGSWPSGFIDHKNGDTKDNRIKNLRLSNARSNGVNQKRHREGKLPGTSYLSKSNTWRAQVMFKGKQIYLGKFTTEKQAHTAYKNKLKELKCFVRATK